MRQYNSDGKPKNDFAYEKPNNGERQRGGCLTAFLVVFIALNLLSFVFAFLEATLFIPYATRSLMPILPLSFVIAACAVAIWNWKIWGYYGLVSICVIGIAINLYPENILSLIGALLFLSVLFSVVNDKIEMFE